MANNQKLMALGLLSALALPMLFRQFSPGSSESSSSSGSRSGDGSANSGPEMGQLGRATPPLPTRRPARATPTPPLPTRRPSRPAPQAEMDPLMIADMLFSPGMDLNLPAPGSVSTPAPAGDMAGSGTRAAGPTAVNSPISGGDIPTASPAPAPAPAAPNRYPNTPEHVQRFMGNAGDVGMAIGRFLDAMGLVPATTAENYEDMSVSGLRYLYKRAKDPKRRALIGQILAEKEARLRQGAAARQ